MQKGGINIVSRPMWTRFGVSIAIFLATFVCTTIPKQAYAHVLPLGNLTTELSINGNRIDVYTTSSGNLNVAGVTYEAQEAWYIKHFTNEFLILDNSAPCAFTLSSFDPSLTATQINFRGFFTCPEPIHDLSDLKIYGDVFGGEFLTYSHFVTVFSGGQRYELFFDREHVSYPDQVQAEADGSEYSYFLTVTGDFIWKGMLHIFTGYDHILFLLSIILLSRKISKLLVVITAFTIAHSITLILASFHIVQISSDIVEPAIAATIAFMAYRNIVELRNDEIVVSANIERWSLAFCFGLIHGLGFASALAESNIPQVFFVPSLLSFNVGIELGQLCILAVVLPILFLIDRAPQRKRILLFASCAIFALAAAWFSVRVLFGESCSVLVPPLLAQILCI